MDSETEMPRIDRSKWPRGPWDDEPDREQWKTAAGLPGLMVRNRLGAWCGYAAVSPSHPLHGKDYGELYDYDTETGIHVSVHGGLTYADKCSGGICHIPEPGEPDDVWWFGFDCAHGGDLLPGYSDRFQFGGAEYRTAAYVRSEVESLARQLAETK